jgi:hypothetical protein
MALRAMIESNMVAIMATFSTKNKLWMGGSLADIGGAGETAVTGGRAVGGGVAADGGAAADEGAVVVGIAGWGGVTALTGHSIAAGGGVALDGGIAVRGGVCGGKKQPSTCGICPFLGSTEAWLLAWVALLWVLAHFCSGGADGGDRTGSGRLAAMVTAMVLFAETGPAGVTWPQAL